MLFEKLSKTLDLGSILLQPWRLTVKDLIYCWTVQIAKKLAFYIFQEYSLGTHMAWKQQRSLAF